MLELKINQVLYSDACLLLGNVFPTGTVRSVARELLVGTLTAKHADMSPCRHESSHLLAEEQAFAGLSQG